VAGLSRPATVVVGAALLAASATGLLHARQRSSAAQDDRRREVTLTVTDAGFAPARIDARLNDIVAVTLTAGDTFHGLAIDAYRIAKRVEPGKPIRFEFRADTTGTFPFYCTLTGTDGHAHDERGELVIRR
jgi:heme/copper-type cytochrome/quinol oxidase subunit 2